MNDIDKLKEYTDFIIEKSRGFCSIIEERILEELFRELRLELKKKDCP